MAEYQNIFTQVQVQGKPEWGMATENAEQERTRKAGFSTLIGWIGNAQLGPVWLGWTGMVSLATGILALNIIGL
ncbi:MAG: photosynthetic reaction center subunit M, partial [Marivita sp.]